MNEKELFQKNQTLSTEFDLYLADHPELEEQIPQNALLVLLPEYDQELSENNLQLAERLREPGQPTVYVKIKKLLNSRLEGLTLQVA